MTQTQSFFDTPNVGAAFTPEQIEQLSEFGGYYARLDARDFQVDGAYQRKLNKLHGQVFWPAFGVITVGHRRDDTWWVIDGQRRRDLALRQGFTELPCVVIENTTPKIEAKVFGVLNVERHAVSAGGRFRAKLEASDPASRDIQRIVVKHGFKLAYNSGGREWPTITAVAALENAYKFSPTGLDESLRLIKVIWLEDDVAIQSMFLKSFSRFVSMYQNDEKWNEAHAIKRFRKYAAFNILQQSNNTGVWLSTSKFKPIVEKLVQIYNKGLRSSRLPEPFTAK